MEDIHHVSNSSQPYVTLDCTEVEHFVTSGFRKDEPKLPPGVHQCEGGLYTFDKIKTTCPACIQVHVQRGLALIQRHLNRYRSSNTVVGGIGVVDAVDLESVPNGGALIMRIEYVVMGGRMEPSHE